MLTLEAQNEIALKNMERLEGRETRMVWAGSIANGAMMIAIVGLIGNTPNPDAAADFFLGPLVLLGIGVFLSGLSALAHTYAARIRVTLSGASTYFPIVKSNFKDDEGTAIDAAVAAYNTLTRKVHEDAELDINRSEPGTAISNLSARLRNKFNNLSGWLKFWSGATDTLFFASFALLLAAGSLAVWKTTHGARIQPPASQASPAIANKPPAVGR